MRTRVHRDATAELEAAAEWYESDEEGLGEEPPNTPLKLTAEPVICERPRARRGLAA